MGLFDFFKKGKEEKVITTDNGVFGPTYLEDFTVHIQSPKNLNSNEWRRQLKTATLHSKFRIKFYGENKGIITQTDFAPQILYAIDSITNQQILLFDGCMHGYNALFSNAYTDEQIKNRQAAFTYLDANDNDLFDIIISAVYGFNYEEEFGEYIDESGQIEIINGTKVELSKVKRDGFDSIQIWVLNDKGEKTLILSEECA